MTAQVSRRGLASYKGFLGWLIPHDQSSQDLISLDRASGGSCSSQAGSKQQEVLGRTRMDSTPARLAPNDRTSTPVESPVWVQMGPPRTGPRAMPRPFPMFCQPYRVPMGAWP